MASKQDLRQSQAKTQNFKQLGTPVGTDLSVIVDQVNIEFDAPLKMSATFPTANAVLNFTSSLSSASDSAKKTVSPVKKQVFSGLVSPTINFQTQALSNAADFDITWPISTIGQFRYAGFTLIGSGKIKVLFSAEAVTEAALPNPGALFVSGGLPIGYVTLVATATTPAFKTAGSATNIIENTKIVRFGSGAGGSSSGGSGNGTGAEVIDLRYRAELQDSFQDIPGAETPVDIAANKTDATLHDVANELFRLNYDASKTVTGTGTAMTLSAAPSFTVKVGDMLVVDQEAREITVVTSQTSYTIASAFTTNPAAAQATVSQAVYTKDLNAFDANGTGQSVSSQITDAISSVLVNYEDSLTLADVIPDWGTAPHVAYHVTTDNSVWTNKQVRQTSLSGQATSVSTTAGTQLRLRFFANKTSGSGAVNLLSYKVFWHEELSEELISSVPIGTVLNFAGTAAPAGFLLCDGSAVSRNAYYRLFSILNTSHGQGDGTTTFNIPDYRGRLLRGVDAGTNRDPDKAGRTAMNTGGNTGDAPGSIQNDAMQGHFHNLVNGTGVHRTVGGTFGGSGTGRTDSDLLVTAPITDGVNGTPRTSSETRPKNAYVNFIIKY